MTAVSNLNVSSELTITPSRKRKRQFERQEQQQEELALKTTAAPSPTSCFTNAAFSSTPKKILARRRLNAAINKENKQTFATTIGLEVKSIAEIVNDTGDVGQVPLNPYEVLRNPPKKKKKPAEEAACFENPALNLDLPEKQFNPYEIVREKTTAANSNCFVNSALNLKTQDVPASRNPFEIRREMPGNSPSIPCSLKIGLPFVPTVGCRIDFKDISMSHLTPSKLLAEKLVFSPVVKGKASLGSIGEEATMDIGKELDRYQLELENSINEAKLRKNGILDNSNNSPVVSSLQINVEQTIRMTQKLTEIKEAEETEEITEEIVNTTQQHTEILVHTEPVVKEAEVKCGTNPFEDENIVSQSVAAFENPAGNTNPFACDENEYSVVEEDLDELYGYGEDDDNNKSFDFKTPAPFVRAYTKPVSPKLRVSKESLNSKGNAENPFDPEEHSKKSLNVKNIIRKSIRKLMHPHHNKREEVIDNVEKLDNDKHSVGLMGAIRQSLRRKQARTLLRNETMESKDCELSIIDGSERTMKFKSSLPQTDYVKIEDLTNEKKNNIRSSIRRSTREMGHQLMKTVFHKKHEEYDFGN